ncbi:hypothetical protein COEREDRAFT_9656 [Coemansia reversa NRRL 1564]|uniref:Uncharacterized protein n=1 Tax=Coemansia reversa (strain ATCC 12441 / NRRL 1564) TaxID=763665 RepID=A0A2G5B8C7_COERN|nr:hypothetical protein COEREDRAFT_9656 [Coemansia reversa NRRL 1564]|eukprot:PIA15278.1 hypothetical protein COEREDRAFT_9656 [Coemansia reversa NRRL 1564]
MSYSPIDDSVSTVSSSKILLLDSLRVHHTQALVNVVSSTLYPDLLDTRQLMKALFELRRHLESPLGYIQSHPATETNAAEVIEHILLYWVCAHAAQVDAQNYNIKGVVETPDKRFDKYAHIPAEVISEAIQCISYLTTMSVGVAIVAKTSIPVSIVLLLNFTENYGTYTNAFRALTKLCTKHSVKRAQADGRWESETGLYAILEAFTRAQTAFRLRNRFDLVANAAYSVASEMANSAGLSISSSSSSDNGPAKYIGGSAAERVVVSALLFVNALVDAHKDVEDRLRIRNEILDTPLYQTMKLLEETEFDSSRAFTETRRFRRAYTDDIKACDPHVQLLTASQSA